MPRPHRPNPEPVRDRNGRIVNHPRQETRQERKARLRREAEERNARTRHEDTAEFRRQKAREMEAARAVMAKEERRKAS